MTNPYEPPKTIQKPTPSNTDLFIRLQKYQWRAFYLGIILAIASTIIANTTTSPIMADVFDLIGSIAGFILFISVGSILPLAIWGFVSGYREGKY